LYEVDGPRRRSRERYIAVVEGSVGRRTGASTLSGHPGFRPSTSDDT
jgi:hypothetical protein